MTVRTIINPAHYSFKMIVSKIIWNCAKWMLLYQIWWLRLSTFVRRVCFNKWYWRGSSTRPLLWRCRLPRGAPGCGSPLLRGLCTAPLTILQYQTVFIWGKHFLHNAPFTILPNKTVFILFLPKLNLAMYVYVLIDCINCYPLTVQVNRSTVPYCSTQDRDHKKIISFWDGAEHFASCGIMSSVQIPCDILNVLSLAIVSRRSFVSFKDTIYKLGILVSSPFSHILIADIKTQ